MEKEKRPYQSPQLVRYGCMTEITKAVASNGMNDSVQGQNNLKTG